MPMSEGSYRLLHSYLKTQDSGSAHRLLGRPQGLLLDIGSGDAVDLESLRARGWAAVGIEPFQTPRVRSWVRGAAESLPFKSESFDAITCILVIPHVAEPRVLVNEAHRVLRTGGRAAFVVFSTSPLNVRIRIRGQRYGTSGILPVRNVYSVSSMRKLLQSAGFGCERIVQGDFLPWLAGMLPVSYLDGLLRTLARFETRAQSPPLRLLARKLTALGVKE